MMRDQRFIPFLARPISELLASDLALSFGRASQTEQVGEFGYLRFPQVGMSVDLGTDAHVAAAFFDHKDISSEWATGIPAHAFREEVLHIFGDPSKSGSARTLPILGVQGAWDRWDYPDHSLHVQYSPSDETVVKVTLMHPSAVPT